MDKTFRQLCGIKCLENILILDILEEDHLEDKLECVWLRYQTQRTTRFKAPSKSPSSAILLFFRNNMSACLASNSGDFVDDDPVAAFRLTNSRHALSRLATNPASPRKLLV